MVTEDVCMVPLPDEGDRRCGQFLVPHCDSPTCTWERCKGLGPSARVHVHRADGHVMGDDTWKG